MADSAPRRVSTSTLALAGLALAVLVGGAWTGRARWLPLFRAPAEDLSPSLVRSAGAGATAVVMRREPLASPLKRKVHPMYGGRGPDGEILSAGPEGDEASDIFDFSNFGGPPCTLDVAGERAIVG